MSENRAPRAHDLSALWSLTGGYRLRYGAAIGALVVASCFLYLAPLLPQVVLDGVLGDAERASAFTRWAVGALGGAAYLRANLWLPALLMVGLTALAGAFTYLRGRWSAEASEGITRRLRDRVYDHLQRLPCRYLDQAETGDLVQRATSDVDTVREFLSHQVVEIGRASIMLLVPLPLMLAIDPGMTLASVALLPLIVGSSLLFFLRVKAVFLAADEAEGRLTATVQESLAGVRVVRAFARREFEEEKLAGRNAEHRALSYRLYVLLAAFWSTSDLLCFLQQALVVGAGVYWLSTGALQVGAFFYFLSAVNLFLWPVRHMGRILSDLGKAFVALGRLREVLDEDAEAGAGLVPAGLSPDLEFEGVRFAHGEATVLDDVSFRAPAGSTLGIVGPSGSGKSTVVDLLLRLYDEREGAVRLGGHEVRELDRAWLRSRLAVVLQQPFLYSRSLRENLRLGRPGATDEEVEEACRLAQVHETILGFEDGYQTVVGERGVTLSGGQRQRVALARALLQEPDLLVLDDSLSAVDTATEGRILAALRARGAAARHTTVIVAHRLSTVMHADQVVVLDEGRVVQRGTHAELAAADGLYRRLWEAQTRAGGVDEGAERAAGEGSGDSPALPGVLVSAANEEAA